MTAPPVQFCRNQGQLLSLLSKAFRVIILDIFVYETTFSLNTFGSFHACKSPLVRYSEIAKQSTQVLCSVDTKTSLTRAKLAVSLIMDSLAKMDLFSSQMTDLRGVGGDRPKNVFLFKICEEHGKCVHFGKNITDNLSKQRTLSFSRLISKWAS